jgi:hypothetical protein
MHGENLRKFTETRARPLRASYALISSWQSIQYVTCCIGFNIGFNVSCPQLVSLLEAAKQRLRATASEAITNKDGHITSS